MTNYPSFVFLRGKNMEDEIAISSREVALRYFGLILNLLFMHRKACWNLRGSKKHGIALQCGDKWWRTAGYATSTYNFPLIKLPCLYLFCIFTCIGDTAKKLDMHLKELRCPFSMRFLKKSSTISKTQS